MGKEGYGERMSIDSEVDEELQRLFDKIDAIKEYLGITWEWDRDMIVGAKKKEKE